MNDKSFSKKVLGFVQDNTVPLMFVLICAVCIPLSGFSVSYLLNEIVTRMGRNIFLILCLLIPIMAGMGLNFGMTLGAMAGEIALIRPDSRLRLADLGDSRRSPCDDPFDPHLHAARLCLWQTPQHGKGP